MKKKKIRKQEFSSNYYAKNYSTSTLDITTIFHQNYTIIAVPGFKDFTKNTGKLGLNFGEKFAFWMYGRVRELSQNGFTHIFLFLIICIYCAAGGLLFYFVENEHQENIRKRDWQYEAELQKNISRVS